MKDELARAYSDVLSQMNPRRFEVLLICMTLTEPFTATDIRDALPLAEPSLPRDLNALEDGGLLTADPPKSESRQGRVVLYWVAPRTQTVFRGIADLVDSAWRSRPPASPSEPSRT